MVSASVISCDFTINWMLQLTCQSISEFVAWRFVGSIKVSVVDIHAFGEVVLREVEVFVLWICHRNVVVGLVSRHCVGKLA